MDEIDPVYEARVWSVNGDFCAGAVVEHKKGGWYTVTTSPFFFRERARSYGYRDLYTAEQVALAFAQRYYSEAVAVAAMDRKLTPEECRDDYSIQICRGGYTVDE